MDGQKKKLIIACAISVLLTFVVTVVLCIGVYETLLDRTILTDDGSGVLSEVKAYIDAMYLNSYDEEELYQQAAKGMTNALDVYTNYYTPAEFESFLTATRGSYVGVGLVLTQTEHGDIMIMQVYEDSPGAQVGVRAGDILVSVNGVSYDELDAAATALRGDGSAGQGEGSPVAALFKRNGTDYAVTMARRAIHLRTVRSSVEDGNVGYFKITSFDEDTDTEFKTQYEALAAQGIQSVLLDLRDNGGGDFYTVCRLASMFLKDGETVVYREDKKGERAYEYAKEGFIDLPVVILANENSASASEVLIGALSGNGRLKALVGTNTFGKGITQNVFPLRHGGGISITVEQYFTPDGKCIHGTGFAPDVMVVTGFAPGYPVEAIERAQDVQLIRALEICK